MSNGGNDRGFFHQAPTREAISEGQKPHHETEELFFCTSHQRNELYNVVNTQSFSLLNVDFYMQKYMSRLCKLIIKCSICIYATSGA